MYSGSPNVEKLFLRVFYAFEIQTKVEFLMNSDLEESLLKIIKKSDIFCIDRIVDNENLLFKLPAKI